MALINFDKITFSLDRVIFLIGIALLLLQRENRLENKLTTLIQNLLTDQKIIETRLATLEEANKDIKQDHKTVLSFINVFEAYVPESPSFQTNKRRK